MQIVASIALAGSAGAIEVTTTPGQLATLIEDQTVTELTITGQMDARDFNYIGTQLTQLTALDLKGVSIVAYSDSSHPLAAGISDFAADVLPQTMLMGSKLERIVLPDSLRAIGYAALAGCDRLTAIELPASVTAIGDYALSGSGLQSISLPATIMTVGKGAFAHCPALASAEVSARQIGDYAFLGDAGLQSLQLGNEVSRVGVEAFHGTGLTTLDLAQATELDSLGAWAVASTPLTTLSLPAQLAHFGEGAFFGTVQLASAKLPASLIDIPDYAFAGGSNIAADTLLCDGVVGIGDYAFYNWSNTRQFFMPMSVSHIGSYAMAGMTGLEQIDIAAEQVPSLGDSVWAGVNQSLVKLGTPDNESAQRYAEAEQWREFYILHDYLLGDVNGDGVVDVTDVNSVINYILGKVSDSFIFVAADLDGSNVIDVSDANSIVNIVLGSIESTTVRRVRGRNVLDRPWVDDMVSVDAFSVKPGESQTIEVRLANSRNYAAMQFDITLPEGLVMVDHVGATTRSARHSNLMRTHASTSRLLSFSMQGADYVNNDDAIVRLTVKATDELAPGATLDISNVLLVEGNGKCYVAPSSSTPVSSTTGVDNLMADNSRVYARGGVLVVETAEPAVLQAVTLNGVSRTWNVPSGYSEWTDLETGLYVVILNGKSYKVSLQ